MLHFDTTLLIVIVDLVINFKVLICKTSLGDWNKTIYVYFVTQHLFPIGFDETSYAQYILY